MSDAAKSVLTPDVLAHIDRLVAAAPPFSQATLDRLAILLRPTQSDVPSTPLDDRRRRRPAA